MEINNYEKQDNRNQRAAFKHNIQDMIDRDMKMLSKPIEFFHDYPPDGIFVKHNWGARVDCGLGTNQNLKQKKEL